MDCGMQNYFKKVLLILRFILTSWFKILLGTISLVSWSTKLYIQMNLECKVCVQFISSLVWSSRRAFVCVMHNMSAAGVLRATSWASTILHTTNCGVHTFSFVILKTIFFSISGRCRHGHGDGYHDRTRLFRPTGPGYYSLIRRHRVEWNWW